MSSRIDAQPDRVRRDGSGHVLFCTDTSLADHGVRLREAAPGVDVVVRGDLVDQAALTDALKANSIAGAGLDVFATEPLPPDDPLWELPNVLITPHNSGSSHGSPLRVIDLFFDNLDLYLAGRPMHYEVPA